jgi:hypothetical protein
MTSANHAEQAEQADEHRPERVGLADIPLLAIALLILTSVVILLTSYYEPMRLDEFFELQTDGVASLRQLIHVQLSSPISLDPLVYHVAAHMALAVFGHSAFALRLPAFFGYLIMQLSLFFFVRRIAPERSAVFALAVPTLTLALYFASEGRPYGLQLGFFALVLVSWQAAARRTAGRAFTLVTLAVAIALVVNTHYFGVLLLVPLGAAELTRSLERRQLDLPVLAAMLSGILGIVLTIPFLKPAGEFRGKYYNAAVFSPEFIPRAYRDFLLHGSRTPGLATVLILVLLAAAIGWACLRQARRGILTLPRSEAVLLVLLAALPVLGYLLARFVTHSIEVRFVLGAIEGISVLVAVALAPVLRGRPGSVLFALLFAVVAVRGAHLLLKDRQATQATVATMALPPVVERALLASPDRLIYFQSMRVFDAANYYEPDPDIRARFTLVYSREQELRWKGFDTIALTATHMQAFTGLRVLPYESLALEPGEHVFVSARGDLDWADEAFAASQARVTPLAPALGGVVETVNFGRAPGDPAARTRPTP